MSRAEALADLMQRIFEYEEEGGSIPCVNPKLVDWWLSEDVEMQEAAALSCTTCPALRDCRAYVDAWPEAGGVWAARIPTTQGRHSRDLLAGGGSR